MCSRHRRSIHSEIGVGPVCCVAHCDIEKLRVGGWQEREGNHMNHQFMFVKAFMRFCWHSGRTHTVVVWGVAVCFAMFHFVCVFSPIFDDHVLRCLLSLSESEVTFECGVWTIESSWHCWHKSLGSFAIMTLSGPRGAIPRGCSAA